MKQFLLIFILTFLFTKVYADENYIIDLEKSFIEMDSPTYKWRTNIQSVLISKNNTYYLMKEIMAESISGQPFTNENRHLHLMLVNEKSINIFRTQPVGEFRRNTFEVNKEVSAKKNIIFNKIKFLSFKEVHEILLNSKNVKIYCSIKYEYNEIKYNLLTICDYLNFSKKNNNFFIQPALGYVPFIDEANSTKNYGYVAFNIGEKNSKLEFILNEIGPIFTIHKNDHFIKRNLKKILNFLTSFKVKNSLSKVVSIDDAQLSFFIY
jgi:hypothetical protein